ncbi:MAG TPA: methoxymalonyl-ACP biosynthesis protein FkbH, partial [Alphaproteobacteria bacterium]
MIPACPPPELYWLPPAGDFSRDLTAARESADDGAALYERLASLAGRRLDFTQTLRLDRVAAAAADRLPAALPRLRLALLGNATLDHLVPGIRVGALRRGLRVETMIAPYGQWHQQILDPQSAFYAFEPDAILLSLDGG